MFSETFELRALAMRVASNQLYPITSGNRKDSAQAVLPIGNLGITNYFAVSGQITPSPAARGHCKTSVIPPKASASADGTSIQRGWEGEGSRNALSSRDLCATSNTVPLLPSKRGDAKQGSSLTRSLQCQYR